MIYFAAPPVMLSVRYFVSNHLKTDACSFQGIHCDGSFILVEQHGGKANFSSVNIYTQQTSFLLNDMKRRYDKRGHCNL